MIAFGSFLENPLELLRDTLADEPLPDKTVPEYCLLPEELYDGLA